MELVDEISCKIALRDTGAEKRWQLMVFLKLKYFGLPCVRNEATKTE